VIVGVSEIFMAAVPALSRLGWEKDLIEKMKKSSPFLNVSCGTG
jgi:hypothetical protein